MSEQGHSGANGSDPSEPARVHGEVEPVDEARHLPVPLRGPAARPLERAGIPLPAPVVAATGGFLAGVVTFVVVRLLRGRRSQLAIGHPRKRRDRAPEVAGSRSFLVDVHVLKR